MADADAPLLDALLPRYDVSDTVACVVAADDATTWKALVDVDLVEVGGGRPGVAARGAARALAEGARGRQP